MKYYKKIDGKTVTFEGILKIGNLLIINPTKEQLYSLGWKLYEEVVSYEELVETLIRQKYTVSQELAIQRQKDNKLEEFNEYFTYCEYCKTKAKNLINYDSN